MRCLVSTAPLSLKEYEICNATVLCCACVEVTGFVEACCVVFCQESQGKLLISCKEFTFSWTMTLWLTVILVSSGWWWGKKSIWLALSLHQCGVESPVSCVPLPRMLSLAQHWIRWQKWLPLTKETGLINGFPNFLAPIGPASCLSRTSQLSPKTTTKAAHLRNCGLDATGFSVSLHQLNQNRWYFC